jgi:hypothetical protein
MKKSGMRPRAGAGAGVRAAGSVDIAVGPHADEIALGMDAARDYLVLEAAPQLAHQPFVDRRRGAIYVLAPAAGDTGVS